MSDLERKLNFQLTTNQVARVVGSTIEIDVFRGSEIRRNKTKMAVLRFPKAEVLAALETDTFHDLVNTAEAALSLPLVPDEFGWQ